MTSLSFFSDADLHGLVDGHLETSRRTDVLKRLASAPADRARLAAWQEQTDLLRAAFTGVDREPIPALLDLAPRTKLHCVADAPIVRRPPEMPATRSAMFPWIAGFGGVAAVSLGCLWFASVSAPRESGIADLRGSVDDTLRTRTTRALAETTATAAALPTTTIPDLTAAGFELVGAESKTSEPVSLMFRYRNAAAERVVISVARSLPAPAQRPARVGDVILWHSRANAFAIAGTIKAERLKAIAAALQADESE